MLPDTPENRAAVNRKIAEKAFHTLRACHDGTLQGVRVEGDKGETLVPDYTRSLDACYDVCEAEGINFAEILSVEATWCNMKTDLRWIVAQAVAEAICQDHA